MVLVTSPHRLAQHVRNYARSVRREGTDPNHVRMEDVLCDFCHTPWTLDRPMVEGHHGSCICGNCLRAAWALTVTAQASDRPEAAPTKCTMCLEERTDRLFQSPAFPEAFICLRCVRLASRAVARDQEDASTAE
ncbi:MAG: hypothetical protein FJ256_01010 [Phycisphaerae bacterium]|nr:hypothetical protein [Phycisphaerae bacterium]